MIEPRLTSVILLDGSQLDFLISVKNVSLFTVKWKNLCKIPFKLSNLKALKCKISAKKTDSKWDNFVGI